MNNILTVGDLHLVADEPRVLDIRIGERLGMAQPLNIRQTIDTNRSELERYGLVHAVREPIRSGKGRVSETTVYYLNEPQTLLLCMFSRTEAAADVRQEVISVYMAYRQGGQPTKRTTAKMPNVSMEFDDYAAIMKSLIAAASAQEQVINFRRCNVYRENRADMIRILLEKTCLSDDDIAERMRDMLGFYMPELVAYHRRKMAEEGQ